jgi:hypothetical protein
VNNPAVTLLSTAFLLFGLMFFLFGLIGVTLCIYGLLTTKDPTLVLPLFGFAVAIAVCWVLATKVRGVVVTATGITWERSRGGHVAVPWSDVLGWKYVSTFGAEILDYPNSDPGKYAAMWMIVVLRYRSDGEARWIVTTLPGLRSLDGPLRESRTALEELRPKIIDGSAGSMR